MFAFLKHVDIAPNFTRVQTEKDDEDVRSVHNNVIWYQTMNLIVLFWYEHGIACSQLDSNWSLELQLWFAAFEHWHQQWCRRVYRP